MKKKALIASSANPYPTVTSGCERLIMDYQLHLLSDYDTYFLLTRSGGWEPLGLFHRDRQIPGDVTVENILSHDFEFILFIGFTENEFIRRLVDQVPSFCLTDIHPRDDLPDALFKGIMAHLSTGPHKDVLLLGACYNSEIFFKNRRSEEFILSVGRIHPDKNQHELVRDYKDRIYEKYGLPLYLVGGVNDSEYFSQVNGYVDNVSVLSTVDPEKPWSNECWKSSRQIADLCNRARMFVMASPKESFCIALIEALACGATCVINGNYWGFDEADIRPNVFGNTTEKRGSVIDLLDEALGRDVRIDGSEWVKKFSSKETKKTLMRFINERL
ncbi:MAG TPA: glycosyltransferase [Blastocatellia bacterium]|jgi:glycosyltransferase involved in cell wall biosynthesis|nr:glycosyltransferase [Blastocatellia bacterium]